MKKISFTFLVVLIMILGICVCGCKKDGTIPNEPDAPGTIGGTETGLYLGIIGFNENLKEKNISLLSDGTKTEFKSFIDNLSINSSTILYHAVSTAIDRMEIATFPDDLVNVSIITFTDGLDEGSHMYDASFGSDSAYLRAVNERIKNIRINGLNISAHSIGLRGVSIRENDIVKFRENLNGLASSPDNVKEVTNMNDVNNKFREIASSLYKENRNQKLDFTIQGQASGTKIRFTFDIDSNSDATISNLYIEGTYNRDENSLSDIVYKGMSSSSGAKVYGTVAVPKVTFSFKDLKNNSGVDVPIDKILQWKLTPPSLQWGWNEEFKPEDDTKLHVERKSAVIMLVLDCSSSLGSDFANMQNSAKNFIDVLLGNEETENVLSKLSTLEATSITSTSATLGGNITSVGTPAYTEKGICYSTLQNPTITSTKVIISGNGTGNYTKNITGLMPNTTYYVRAYARNSIGIAYGNQVVLKTLNTTNELPSLSTLSATNITSSSATLGGNITSVGTPAYTERGICYSILQNPTTSATKVIISGNGTGNYTKNITGLTPNKIYYVRAYARNSEGTVYGNQIDFITGSNPQNVLIRFQKTDNYTSVTEMGISLEGGDIRYTIDLGINSVVSEYFEFSAGNHIPWYYYTNDGYEEWRECLPEPYTYSFIAGRKYTIVCSDDGENHVFYVIFDGIFSKSSSSNNFLINKIKIPKNGTNSQQMNIKAKVNK